MVAFYALPVVSMLLRSVADPAWTLENYRGSPATRYSCTSSGSRFAPPLVVTLGTLLLGIRSRSRCRACARWAQRSC